MKRTRDDEESSPRKKQKIGPLSLDEKKLNFPVPAESPVPDACKTSDCCLGIDEAGRGPVLGSLIYGIAYLPVSQKEQLKNLGVDDSKKLKEGERDRFFEIIKSCPKEKNIDLGWIVDVLSPEFLSAGSLSKSKTNLNSMSHDSAIGLIRNVIAKGVRVTEVYVDTVGVPEHYQEKLENLFPGIDITVAKKADSIYPVVSAASICAKVVRDFLTDNWQFRESGLDNISRAWGCGYPGDTATKAWLRDNIDPVFGFPSFVRFSWGTSKLLLQEEGVGIDWEPSDDDDFYDPNQRTLFSMVKKGGGGYVAKRHRYFKDRGMTCVEQM